MELFEEMESCEEIDGDDIFQHLAPDHFDRSFALRMYVSQTCVDVHPFIFIDSQVYSGYSVGDDLFEKETTEEDSESFINGRLSKRNY